MTLYRKKKNYIIPLVPIKKGLILANDYGAFISNGRFNSQDGTIGAYGGIIFNRSFYKARTKDRWAFLNHCKKATIDEVSYLKKAVEKYEEDDNLKYKAFIYINNFLKKI